MADDQQRPPYGPPQPQWGNQQPPPPPWGNQRPAPPPWQQAPPPQQGGPAGQPPRPRRWWLWTGIVVVVVALVAVFVVRFINARQLVAVTPPVPSAPAGPGGASATTTPSARPDPGAPVRCPQEQAGLTDCFPISISALRSALTAQGFHCAPEDGVPTNTTCDKPSPATAYTVQFGSQNGGVDTILYSGTVSGYVGSMTKTQDDAFDNAVQAMNTMLTIVFPHSPALRSTLSEWMRSQRETLKTRSADTTLSQGYQVGCTDGSPVDIAGARGTFRTWTFPCTMQIAPH